MPDRRRHRGPHPEDAALFADPDHLRKLSLAAGDLAWLLGRSYASQAALTLVGSRYQLHQRQRRTLARAALDAHVDASLKRANGVVATSNSAILDRAARCFDLAGAVL